MPGFHFRTTLGILIWTAVRVCAAEPPSQDSFAERLNGLASDTLPAYQEQAKESLAAMGPETLVRLITAYSKSSPSQREGILEVVGRRRQAQGCSFLMQALRTGARREQCRAMEALARIGCQESSPLILEKVNSSDVSLRCFAIWSCGELGSRAAVPRLRQILRETRDFYPVVSALDALGKIGDKQAVPDITPFLKHQELQVRYTAALALGNLEDSGAVEPLFEAMDREPDFEVQEVLAESLGNIGGRDVLARFITLFRSRNSLPRRHLAAKGLAKIGLPAVDYLRECLRDPDWEIQLASIKLLGEMNAQAAVPDLIRVLEGSNKSLQLAAAVALGQMEDARALAALEMVKASGDALLQDTAQDAITRILGKTGAKK